MKKILLMGAMLLVTLAGAQAQTKNTNPVTDGTTKNSGVGNATNGSARQNGTTDAQGAVGTENGTAYGMQATVPTNTTMTQSTRKDRKAAKRKKNS